MSRIDVQTLVYTFEQRIEALEKNPPDKVPTAVVLKLLEGAIEDILKEHFVHLLKKNLKNMIYEKYNEIHEEFLATTIKNTFNDKKFRKKIEDELKNKFLKGLSRD